MTPTPKEIAAFKKAIAPKVRAIKMHAEWKSKNAAAAAAGTKGPPEDGLKVSATFSDEGDAISKIYKELVMNEDGNDDPDIVTIEQQPLPALTKDQMISLIATYNEALSDHDPSLAANLMMSQLPMGQSYAALMSGEKGWRTRSYIRGSIFSLGRARIGKKGQILFECKPIEVTLASTTEDKTTPVACELPANQMQRAFGVYFKQAFYSLMGIDLHSAMLSASGVALVETPADQVATALKSDPTWGDW